MKERVENTDGERQFEESLGNPDPLQTKPGLPTCLFFFS